jgi:hypothetical protein
MLVMRVASVSTGARPLVALANVGEGGSPPTLVSSQRTDAIATSHMGNMIVPNGVPRPPALLACACDLGELKIFIGYRSCHP